MRRSRDPGDAGARQAMYENYCLTMQLPQCSIDTQRFIAASGDYEARLLARQDIPAGLQRLIRELFQRNAITRCSISYGHKMELELVRIDERGRELLVGRVLERFSAIFADITGTQIAATWRAASEARPDSRNRTQINSIALLRAVAVVIDTVADGLQVAAAIKILEE